MEIYIEDAILQNTIINYILIRLSEKAVLQKTKKMRIWISCFVGTGITLLINFIQISSFLLVCLKILIALLMTFICIENFVFKKISLFFVVFLSSTFLMGGFFIGIENLLGIKVNGLISIISAFIYYKLLSNVLIVFYTKRKLNKFYFNLKLKNCDRELNIKAYLDSGNLLQDDETGLSILVLDYQTFINLFNNEITLMDYLQKKLDKKIKGRYISVGTVGGKSNMFVCKIDKVLNIEDKTNLKEIQVLIGVGLQNFKNKDCNALLSPLAL